MLGFDGPFAFDVDDEGTELDWKNLSSEICDLLRKTPRATPENSKVYLCSINVRHVPNYLERHHAWEKVKRVLIEAKPVSRKIDIVGAYPVTKKTESAKQREMEFLAGGEAEANLFQMLRFKLNLSNKVKQNARIDRYAIMASYNKSFAQWVFSEGWEEIGYEIYLYIVVPNRLPKSERELRVSINPIRKGNRPITQAAVFDHPVAMP